MKVEGGPNSSKLSSSLPVYTRAQLHLHTHTIFFFKEETQLVSGKVETKF